MQPTTQRPSGDVSAQPGYAPIAWSAIAALVLAVGFVVVLLGLAVGSYRNGIPLTDSWIPFVPALVVVLAFVARRQIRASEGTRTGEAYANAAWWIAVVSGVAFVAYLLGVNFTVQKDAKAVVAGWADNLKDLDAFDPKDPGLYAACLLTLPPGARPTLPKDTRPDAAFVARMDQAFGDAVAGFRQTDVVRVCQRNRGRTTLVAQGLKDWAVKANEIGCVVSAVLTTPEGEYGLLLPMRAAVDDKGVRRWQIQPAGPEGYVKTRTLTRAGWDIDGVERDGLAFGREMLLRMGQQNQFPLLYLGYVHPGWEPNRAVSVLNQFMATAPGLGAAAGMLTLPEVRGTLEPRDRQPLPPGWYDTLTRTVFVKPDGSPHTPADIDRLWRVWTSPNLIAPAGNMLKGNPDTNGVLALGKDTVELRMPIEIFAGTANAAFKGRLVFRLPPAEAAAVLAERAAATQTDRSSERPAGFIAPRRPWRLVRLETDLKASQGEAPPRQPGGGV